MTFDRSKIKGAKVSSIVETRKEADKQSRFFSKGYTDFLKVEPGMNSFRIAPPHNPEHTPFVPLRTTWLEVETDEVDENNNPTGKKVIKNRRIFIATIHGGLQKDPVETYIKYVRKRAEDEFTSKEDRSKFLSPIIGWRGKDGKWNPGIQPSTNYVCYAWDRQWNFGRLELYPKDITEIEKLNIDEETGEPIETDVFTDPDTGRWLNINLFKNDKDKSERILTKREFIPKKGIKSGDLAKAWEEFEESCRIPDDKLKEWSEKDSLHSIYVGTYSFKDFDMAVNGLARFDAKHGYGIFENSEFIDELEEISSILSQKEAASQNNESENEEQNPEEQNAVEIPKVNFKGETQRQSRFIKPKEEFKEVQQKPVKDLEEEEEEEQEPEKEEEYHDKQKFNQPTQKPTREVDNTPKIKIDDDIQAKIAALRAKVKSNN